MLGLAGGYLICSSGVRAVGGSGAALFPAGLGFSLPAVRTQQVPGGAGVLRSLCALAGVPR